MSIFSSLMGASGKPSGKPYAEIKFGGSAWKSKDAGIVNVEVDMGTSGGASTCNILIKGKQKSFKENKLKLSSDFASIKVGSKLEVALGYISKDTFTGIAKKDVTTVFRGFVCDLVVEVDYTGAANVTVIGMDGIMWLMASRLTKCFGEKKSYSDAVQMVYKDNTSSFSGLSVDSTGKLSTPIYMYDESYYEFCMRASKATGNYFFVFLGVLYFVDLQKHKSVKLQLTPKADAIKRLLVRSSPLGIPKSVEVRSISEKDSSKLVKSNVSSVSAIGEGKDATGLTTNIKNKIIIYDESVKTMAEAKERAQSELEQKSINLVETELEIYGNPNVGLATGLKLSGFGNPVDNSYVVTRIRHICDFKTNNFVTIVGLSANKMSPQSGGLGGALSGLSSLF